jgi:formylglycine-generating enzyme required for sulfatase activity
MRKLLVLISIACFTLILAPAHAAKIIKAAKPVKEHLVLMPMLLGAQERSLQGAMETALIEGLEQKYEVYSGDRVRQKVKEIFSRESKVSKKECDETRCMEDIAIAFQAELIAVANVTKQEGGYFLALSIQNIADQKAVYSKSLPCKGCDAFQVISMLKELSGASVQENGVPSGSTPTIVLPSVPTAPRVSGGANDAETQVWAEMVAGNKIEDYKFYLDNYPQGKYAKQATEQKQKLEAYAKAKADAAIAQENEQAWSIAQQTDSVTSYSQYLNKYPSGSYAALAKIKKNKAAAAEEAAAIPGMAANMVAIPGKNYELGKYEVTQTEWQALMGSNPSKFSSCGDTCPVEQVSWDDIQTFLQKLNAKSGRQYRLPTEAEWEYACYGGNQTEYCGSSNVDAVAWYDGNSNSTTHPVGQKQANGYGLYDMSGNVWEWMENAHESGGRVLRGGSWLSEPQNARAAYRFRDEPALRNDLLGFRLARTLP